MAEQPWDSVGELRVIAPSTKSTRVFLAMFGVMTALGGLLTQATIGHGVETMASTRVLGIGLIMLLSGGLALVTLAIWTVNARLFVGPRKVGYRTILRRSRFWSRGEISRVLDMAIDYGWTSKPQRGLYFLGRKGQRLFTLTPRMWHANELGDFVEASGALVDRREEPVRFSALKREFPSAFAWGVGTFVLAALLTIGAAVVLVIVGYAVLFIHPR